MDAQHRKYDIPPQLWTTFGIIGTEGVEGVKVRHSRGGAASTTPTRIDFRKILVRKSSVWSEVESVETVRCLVGASCHRFAARILELTPCDEPPAQSHTPMANTTSLLLWSPSPGRGDFAFGIQAAGADDFPMKRLGKTQGMSESGRTATAHPHWILFQNTLLLPPMRIQELPPSPRHPPASYVRDTSFLMHGCCCCLRRSD